MDIKNQKNSLLARELSKIKIGNNENSSYK